MKILFNTYKNKIYLNMCVINSRKLRRGGNSFFDANNKTGK